MRIKIDSKTTRSKVTYSKNSKCLPKMPKLSTEFRPSRDKLPNNKKICCLVKMRIFTSSDSYVMLMKKLRREKMNVLGITALGKHMTGKKITWNSHNIKHKSDSKATSIRCFHLRKSASKNCRRWLATKQMIEPNG